MTSNISVLVSGAGVAGLTTAYWLDRRGFMVTVIERASEPRAGGQALDIRGPALEVAKRMGILAALEQRKTKLRGVSMVDGGGQEFYRSTDRTLTGGRLDSPDLEVLRDDLCQVLLGAVSDRIVFVYGDSITSIHQDDTGVDVAFSKRSAERFDLVIGADGLHSGVRRLAFGADERFLHYLGLHIGVFSVPNFLGLDRWQVFCQDGEFSGLVLGMDKNDRARAYLGFESTEPLDYDARGVDAQKQLIVRHYAGAQWEFPRLLAHMQESDDFYFYSASQVRMDSWSRGRVVLVGDAGYSVTPASGQGTSISMVGAYVLAGELAAHAFPLVDGIQGYEGELREYVIRNLDLAFEMSNRASVVKEGAQSGGGDSSIPGGMPDFEQLVVPFALKDY